LFSVLWDQNPVDCDELRFDPPLFSSGTIGGTIQHGDSNMGILGQGLTIQHFGENMDKIFPIKLVHPFK
jgi:hypothetical protein